jgi:PAS domain-containing protein
MPPPEVTALADQVRAHLTQGDLAGLGPVELPPDGVLPDAARAARIVLADVAHRLRRDRGRWHDLARQLHALQQAAAAHARHPHVGRWAWDLAADRMSWSDQQYRIFGLTPGAGPLTLATVLARLHPDDVARVRAVTAATVRSGARLDYEARLVRPDGAVRVFRSRGMVRSDARGRPAWMLGTVEDVTERGPAEDRGSA